MQLRSLGQEDPLEEGMATHSSTLSWRIPWTEEPGGLLTVQVHLSWRVDHHWSDLARTPVQALGALASVLAASRVCCPKALPEQGSNPCPPHWQVDSQPPDHQTTREVPAVCLLTLTAMKIFTLSLVLCNLICCVCNFLYVSCVCGLLNFLDLWIYSFHQIRKFSDVSSNCFWSLHFSSPSKYTYVRLL